MPQQGVAVSRGDRDRSPYEERVPAPKRTATPVGHPSPPSLERTPTAGGVPGRRTVTIRGQGAERYVPARSSSRRRPERRYERAGFRPDRTAMWAVLLGLMLILAAVTSAHAATLHTISHLH